jgi:uncharacterized protein (UPF0332 family)
MNIKECIEERLLRIIPPDPGKRDSSIKTSEKKLKESRALLESHFFNQAILTAYTSMFHVARALLYRDGIQEKSHYAVYIYLKEKYGNKISKTLLNAFESYQKERHNILYGFENDSGEEEAKESVFYASDFIVSIKLLLNIK